MKDVADACRRTRFDGSPRLALPRQQQRRDEPAKCRHEKQNRKCRQRRSEGRAALQPQAASCKADQHSHLPESGAAAKIARPNPVRDQRIDPAGPRRSRGHARSPVNGRQQKQHGYGDRPHRGRDGQRQKTDRLTDHAGHDPPPMRSHPPHRDRREHLQHCPSQERNARNQSGDQFPHSQRQRKGRQKVLADPDHHAARHAVGHNSSPQIASHSELISDRQCA